MNYMLHRAIGAGVAIDAIELDFLPVGEKTKSGDAIAIRYGQLAYGTQEIMVVDGGDLSAGQALVDHLQSFYGYDVIVTHMVCTHFDGDHASGLRRVLEQLPVLNLWVHQPWNHARDLLPAFSYRWTEQGLAKHLRDECFPLIAELCDIAEGAGVALHEPYAGMEIGPFKVLAPSLNRYLALVPLMGQTPQQRSVTASVFDMLRKAADVVFGTFESWGIETLADPKDDSTSVPNETSVVLFGQIGERRLLMTGDAGVGALQEAVDVANILGLPLASPDLVQTPHHGSRHNVGPTILDSILGTRVSEGIQRGWAIASCAKECPKKPYRSVTNAFHRRGYRTTTTKASLVNWRVGYDCRPGIVPATTVPFHNSVED